MRGSQAADGRMTHGPMHGLGERGKEQKWVCPWLIKIEEEYMPH